jgi:acetyl-CoA carboxylase biotin carboxyl carrier protein
MTLDEIKHLIEFIRELDLTEFELEHNGMKIRIKSGSAPQIPVVPTVSVVAAPPATPLVAMAPPVQVPPPAAALASPVAEDDGPELAIVKSPLLGTFYRAEKPGAKPFVNVGDSVKKDDVLCIVEAMKLMNEIKSEYDGEVVNVYIEDSHPVQYGERLFAIRLK